MPPVRELSGKHTCGQRIRVCIVVKRWEGGRGTIAWEAHAWNYAKGAHTLSHTPLSPRVAPSSVAPPPRALPHQRRQSLARSLPQARPSAHEPRRLLWEGERWWHQAWLGDHWADVCELTGETMPSIDQEIASWYASTHPESAFRREPMVARALPDGGEMAQRLQDDTLKRLADEATMTNNYERAAELHERRLLQPINKSRRAAGQAERSC